MDTNLLILSSKLNFDPFEKIEELRLGRVEFVVLSPVMDELLKIARRGPKLERRVKFALQLAGKCKLVKVPLARDVDEALVGYSAENRAVIATADIELRRRLRKLRLPVILMRRNGRMDFEGPPAEYRA